MPTTLVRVLRFPSLALIAIAVAVVSVASLDAQAPRKGFTVFRAFQDRFTFEYPYKDWETVPGGTSSLVALAQKKREAAVVVEYQPLRLELAPNEIDQDFAKLEAEPVTSRQPNAADVTVKLIDVGSTRVIVVEYTRKGIAGAERVRQYSLPLGKQLYRLVCSAPAALFAKHEPTFAAMVESFKVAAAPAGSR
jgi:PsbP